MTLWPPQKQATEEMWETYRRRTSPPSAFSEDEPTEQEVEQPPDEGGSPTSSRRGKLSENPQPAKDA